MQSLAATSSSDSVVLCARELLESAPILIGYIRFHMRRHRQGLSVPQFRALFKVRKEPAATLSAVAEHLGASLPTASRIVDKLVAKGFLTRHAGTADRRQVALHLTPRGRAILDAAHAATHAQMESQLRRLSAGDRAAICQAMSVLRSLLSAEEAAPGAPSADGLAVRAPEPGGKPRRRRLVPAASLTPAQRG